MMTGKEIESLRSDIAAAISAHSNSIGLEHDARIRRIEAENNLNRLINLVFDKAKTNPTSLQPGAQG